MEKERSSEWCPQLWSPEDCRYQSVEVIKWPLQWRRKNFPVKRIIKKDVRSSSAIIKQFRRISFIHFPSLRLVLCRSPVSLCVGRLSCEDRKSFLGRKKFAEMDKNNLIVVVGLVLINSCSFALIVVLILLWNWKARAVWSSYHEICASSSCERAKRRDYSLTKNITHAAQK